MGCLNIRWFIEPPPSAHAAHFGAAYAHWRRCGAILGNRRFKNNIFLFFSFFSRFNLIINVLFVTNACLLLFGCQPV